ncbi:MAG: hypothetical protein FI707_15185 [SAR202 cluster bacterium]|nr:hypothetical protein [SAR202 cluster bacterium]MQG70119.1 hypothetical protein [SAR202 cluster bacterium]
MAILTHGPETCAAAIAEIGDKANSALAQLEVGSEKNGVTIEGFWVDPPGHQFYLLADAPNAHAVSQLTVELQLFHWNTVDIHAVITVEEARSLIAH